ncbi:MAG: class I SAM-dependent methyltransferase [Myxococcales bacterium]|nr:class I SAM-dependent methyltransferase [Myxococcales bacterium]
MDFELFDKRNYPTLAVRDGYAEWAATYDDTVADRMDLDLFARQRAVRFESAEVLDLACGTGRIGAWLAARGAKAVDGVDLTPEMLERAAQRGVYRRLIEGNVRDTTLGDESYDVCTQSLACDHLPELEPVYREVCRVLRPAGHFVLVGYHPHFLLSGIPTHFDRQSGGSIAIENHVHLLSDHFKAARSAGLSLLELDERLVDDAWLAERPKWAKYRSLPLSFLMAFCRD